MVTLSALDLATPPGVNLADDNGRWRVLDAPPVAEFACALLARPPPDLAVDEAGYVVVADTVAYRPLRLRQHLSGQLMLICERVR